MDVVHLKEWEKSETSQPSQKPTMPKETKIKTKTKPKQHQDQEKSEISQTPVRLTWDRVIKPPVRTSLNENTHETKEVTVKNPLQDKWESKHGQRPDRVKTPTRSRPVWIKSLSQNYYKTETRLSQNTSRTKTSQRLESKHSIDQFDWKYPSD